MTGHADWWDRALCAQTDPDLFHPPPGGSTNKAKAVCRRCDVRAECLDHALRHETGPAECYGIWGGLTYNERAQLLREAGAA